MSTVTELSPVEEPVGVRSALIITVAGSALAGLIHAAAARSHQGDSILVWMFVLCAIAQVGWAVAAARRPTRTVLALGIALNATAVVFWGLSRSVGIPFIEPLRDAEVVGAQDLSAALFAAASVGGAVCMLARPVARAVMTPVWTGVLAAFALLAAMPALTAGHTHDPAEHDLHVETAATAHDHGGEAASASTHEARSRPRRHGHHRRGPRRARHRLHRRRHPRGPRRHGHDRRLRPRPRHDGHHRGRSRPRHHRHHRGGSRPRHHRHDDPVTTTRRPPWAPTRPTARSSPSTTRG